MHRINVIGTTGSGKSTFAKALANKLGYQYIEMDQLSWMDNWVARSDEEMKKALKYALQKEQWVLDGNYNHTEEIKWKNVDTIIWLDYPFWLVLYRVTIRSIYRALTHKKLWGTNNYESFSKLLSRDSMILWMITSYPKIKKRYSQIFSDQDKLPHVKKIIFSKPSDAQDFIEKLTIQINH